MIFRQFLHTTPIGASFSGKPASTIGFERRFNHAFATEDREAFVRLMLADIPAPPTDAVAIRSANLDAIRSTVAIRS